MNRTTIIAVALAALIAATGFAAAAPGSAPVSVDTGADGTDAADHPANDNAQSADDRDNGSENGTAAGADDRNGQGPAGDLPEQVPDHVSAIHDRISAFLSGDLETSLGDAIGDVTPDDEDAADEDDATESGDEADEDSDADDTADEDGDASEDADADEDSTDGEDADENDDSADE